ncbi:MAG TPA: hypothetical protein VN408_41910 [Actinoplanes sp.]|nr:hypothetical protein [Actinoplanes sp.]
MRFESDLLHQLPDEPPARSSVDIHGAIRSGRRRKAVRRGGYAATGAAVAIAAGGLLVLPRASAPAEVAGPTAAPTSCEVQVLPLPDGVRSAVVNGSDSSGRYLAGRTEPAADPILWQNGLPRKLDFPGDGRSTLTDVNTGGTAVGWGFTADTDRNPVPYVYRQGVPTPLPAPAGGRALAINDAGVIAGESDGTAVRWPSSTASPVSLPVPDDTKTSLVVGIDDDGTVIGHADWRTFVWRPDGTRIELPPQTIDGSPATITMPNDISNGRALVTAATTDQKSASFLWTLTTNTVERITEPTAQPGKPSSQAGASTPQPGDSTLQAGALTATGWTVATDTTRNLPVLITGRFAGSSATGPTLPLPLPEGGMPYAGPLYRVDDNARSIIGHIIDSTSAVRPILWTCR